MRGWNKSTKENQHAIQNGVFNNGFMIVIKAIRKMYCGYIQWIMLRVDDTIKRFYSFWWGKAAAFFIDSAGKDQVEIADKGVEYAWDDVSFENPTFRVTAASV